MKPERRYFYQVLCQCETPEPERTEWTTFTNVGTGEIKVTNGFGGLVCKKCGCVVPEPVASSVNQKGEGN